MPVHRVPKATVREDVAAIEHLGERIVCVTDDGDSFVVFTDRRPTIETRGAWERGEPA